MKTTILAALVAALPAIAFAACSGHEQTAQSCAEGAQWDAEKGACVPTVTG